jgi:hypothetical protein
MMVFNTTEHYPYFENELICEKECLICHNNISHNLIIQNKYNFNCECYKLFHEKCLQIWYEKNNTCPICKKSYINENNNLKLFKLYKIIASLILLIEIFIYLKLFYVLIVVLVNVVNELFH